MLGDVSVPPLALRLVNRHRGRGFAERKLRERVAEGKEDPARLDERRGIAGVPRPEGPLIWFHAASVGESLALLELIRTLLAERPEMTILVTTGTVISTLPPEIICHSMNRP
mgnify:CR=1 FL=1